MYNQGIQMATIHQQPGAAPMAPGHVYIPMPQPMQGVPPGLEYLTMVDTIIVKQKKELLEIATGWEARNKYSLKNANGEQVYLALEESACCSRQCCGSRRGFTIHIMDNFQREVMLIRRPFKCCAAGPTCLACCSCCAQECTIEAPPGVVIGTVRQRFACFSDAYYVLDEKGEEIFKMAGPCCFLMDCCQDKDYPIQSMQNGDTIGHIKKKWGGCIKESFTDADVFSVTFPIMLDSKMKAALVGATFLIDFMAFEQTAGQDDPS